MKQTLIKEKKAQVGMDIVKAVFMVLLILGVLGVVVILVFSTLTPIVTNLDTATTSGSTTENNKFINDSGYTLANVSTSGFTYVGISIKNATDSVVVASGNWTLNTTSFVIKNATATVWTNVNITYTYTYKPQQASEDMTSVSNNISNGVVTFFSYIPTIMSILAVVVIIAGVAILILYVKGFEGRESGGGM